MWQDIQHMQFLEEMKAMIVSNVDFRNGVEFNFKSVAFEDSTQEVHANGLVVEMGWKGNVHLQVYYRGSRFYYVVVRNGEQVSASYYAGKPDEKFFKSVQKLVNEIENGDFDKKKTRSEKVAEIVQKRQLTSYMNETKWKEFLHAMTEEMPVALPYDYKTLFEDHHEMIYFGTAYDVESFNWYDFKSIEWVAVKPCFEEQIYQGRMVGYKNIHQNFAMEFLTLMEKYSIPYEYDSTGEVYFIYGYK